MDADADSDCELHYRLASLNAFVLAGLDKRADGGEDDVLNFANEAQDEPGRCDPDEKVESRELTAAGGQPMPRD